MDKINNLNSISPSLNLDKANPFAKLANSQKNYQNKVNSANNLKKIAKDFEGLFLNSIMKEMNKPIIESGMFNTSGMQQSKGIFTHFFSKELADQGGLGLWKNIYKDLSQQLNQKPTTGNHSIEAEL